MLITAAHRHGGDDRPCPLPLLTTRRPSRSTIRLVQSLQAGVTVGVSSRELGCAALWVPIARTV